MAAPRDEEKFEAKVPDGTPLNTAVSSLIKEIRRGNELEALYWARQIEKPFYKYVWRRLMIFAAEDVGLGDPLAIVVVNALHDAYMAIRSGSSSKQAPDGNLITMAVLYMSRATKNRETDHLKNVEHVLEKRGWMPGIPTYALDQHTKEGKARGQSKAEKDREWFLEASRVLPEVGPYDARLWHLRRIALEGAIDPVEVENMAQAWFEAGDLRYGLEGRYPRPDAFEEPPPEVLF